MTRPCTKGLLLCTLFSIPSPAHAQDQPSSLVSPKRAPGLTFSVGVGLASFGPSLDHGNLDTFQRSRTPVVSGSVEVAMNRFMRLQGEVFTWREETSASARGSTRTGPLGVGYTGDWTFARRERFIVMAGNVIGRLGFGRVHANAGAGAGLGTVRRKHSDRGVGCVPHVVGACDVLEFSYDRWSTTLIWQFLAGVDVVLTPRMTAFANIRAAGFESYNTIMMGGIRWRLE